MASRIKVLEDNFPQFKGDENMNQKFQKIVDYLYIQKEQLCFALEKIDEMLKVLESGVKDEIA